MKTWQEIRHMVTENAPIEAKDATLTLRVVILTCNNGEQQY